MVREIASRTGEPDVARHPDDDVERDEGAKNGRYHQRMKQRSKRKRHFAMGPLGDETRAKAQGQQRF